MYGFNPRPCARGDCQGSHLRTGRPGFNPRPCARGDEPRDKRLVKKLLFQSTPLREGRPSTRLKPWAPMRVSIHAPARGATFIGERPFARRFSVSIHAPARGATRRRLFGASSRQVSIHAPARGATSRPPLLGGGGVCFNPRPCARGDIRAGLTGAVAPSFNPRPCARGDLIVGEAQLLVGRFNPRPCARGDGQRERFWSCSCGFNPRPCARGDSARGFQGAKDEQFQSTPLREGRHGEAVPDPLSLDVSIHAPARGATSGREGQVPSRGTFQSTPLREGRPGRSGAAERCTGFNPRPCARGDADPCR